MGKGLVFHWARGEAIKSKKSSGIRNKVIYGSTLFLWIVTAWLLFPLISLDSVGIENAKAYLYRSALGITIMVIFFGKAVFDLLFPQVTLRKMPLVNTIFLTLYSVVIGGGIIFMVARMITLYLGSHRGGFAF